MELLKIIATTIFSVISLFIITKIMGHKQVAQLDFFDYISGITIGSIAAEMATDLESPWKGGIALLLYGCTSVLLSLLTHKFPKARKYINGTPTILMHDGQLYRKNIKKAKLDLSEFLLLCREQGYFDLADIQTAVWEHNGKLSVLPVSTKRPLTPSDMQLQPEPAHMGTELIMDGEILDENLKRMGRDVNWLTKQLRTNGYSTPQDIFLAIYHPNTQQISLYTPE